MTNTSKIPSGCSLLLVCVAVSCSSAPAQITPHVTAPGDANVLLKLVNNQAANEVLGQPDAMSCAASGDANQMAGPIGRMAIDANVLYVAQWYASRINAYAPAQNGNQLNLSFQWGAASPSTGVISEQTLSSPEGLSSDGTHLVVGDAGFNRVLIYRPLPNAVVATSTIASQVLGQPTFEADAPSCGAAGLSYPVNPLVAHGRLIVPDNKNGRVLIWNTLPTSTHGAPADLVLGQADMMSCGSNCGNPSAPDLLCSPVDAWTDGTRLVVLDGTPGGRLLIWNTFPTANQQPADVVMTGAITADGNALVFGGAGNLASNGTQLFFATDFGNRVLVWNTFPTRDVLPDVVLGQASLTSAPPAGGCAATSFNRALGLLLTNKQLFVADFVNNRVLVFNSL